LCGALLDWDDARCLAAWLASQLGGLCLLMDRSHRVGCRALPLRRPLAEKPISPLAAALCILTAGTIYRVEITIGQGCGSGCHEFR
jgi:hypothetical protein